MELRRGLQPAVAMQGRQPPLQARLVDEAQHRCPQRGCRGQKRGLLVGTGAARRRGRRAERGDREEGHGDESEWGTAWQEERFDGCPAQSGASVPAGPVGFRGGSHLVVISRLKRFVSHGVPLRNVARSAKQGSGAASARLALQVAVDRRAGDAELVGDLLHRMCPSPVVAELVVHRLGDLGLARRELGLLSARATARAGGVEAVAPTRSPTRRSSRRRHRTRSRRRCRTATAPQLPGSSRHAVSSS